MHRVHHQINPTTSKMEESEQVDEIRVDRAGPDRSALVAILIDMRTAR